MSIQAIDSRTDPKFDPFRLGWRYVKRKTDDGEVLVEQVPLTREDILHPEEGDFIVQNHNHLLNCIYIFESLTQHLTDRADVRVFHDHRINWQHPTIRPHGPDITVFENVTKPWSGTKATFPVVDMGAKPILTVEVTSQSTRSVDLNEKFFHFAELGIPYYLIVDYYTDEDSNVQLDITGYKNTIEGYVHLPLNHTHGVWIPSVGLWFSSINERVICKTKDLQVIDDNPGLHLRLKEEKERAKIAEERAMTAEQRAQNADDRANQEKLRADALEAELAALKAKLGSPGT